MEVVYSSKFEREYKKLPLNVKKLAETAESFFLNDPFDVRIKTHKLHGRLKDFYSFSIGYKYRIVFDYISKDMAHFHSIGNHNIYQ